MGRVGLYIGRGSRWEWLSSTLGRGGLNGEGSALHGKGDLHDESSTRTG